MKRSGRAGNSEVEASVLMAEKIPNSELVVFEESCHYLFIDEHEKFIVEISSFIQRRSEDFQRKD